MNDFLTQPIKVMGVELPVWAALAGIGGFILFVLLITTGDPGSGPHPGDGAGAINEP